MEKISKNFLSHFVSRFLKRKFDFPYLQLVAKGGWMPQVTAKGNLNLVYVLELVR